MGFGHRVYKNYDPRATVMRDTCHEVLAELGINDPMLDLALELERIALEDSYFVEKNYIRTWTFTRASSFGRRAFRLTCSPCSCHRPYRRDGSRTGKK